MLSSNAGKTAVLAILVTLIGALHFLVPTEPHRYHVAHVVLSKLYYLPPVMSAAWFGLRGAVLTTGAVSVVLALHAFLDWSDYPMEQANLAGELFSLWALGLIAGGLFERERTLLKDVAKAHEETLQGLVYALDLRERNTRRHSERVRAYALLLAERLGLAEEEKRFIGYGALLHDVGKIGTPDAILLKPGTLTDEERKIICEHAQAGYRIVSGVGYLRKAAEIVHAHHERFDGGGYPRGLKGEEIPLGARLFAVIDVYDALTTERPYREPLTHEDAIDAMRKEAGGLFDPEAFAAFTRLDRAELERIRAEYRDQPEALLAATAP